MPQKGSTAPSPSFMSANCWRKQSSPSVQSAGSLSSSAKADAADSMSKGRAASVDRKGMGGSNSADAAGRAANSGQRKTGSDRSARSVAGFRPQQRPSILWRPRNSTGASAPVIFTAIPNFRRCPWRPNLAPSKSGILVLPGASRSADHVGPAGRSAATPAPSARRSECRFRSGARRARRANGPVRAAFRA